MHQTLILPVPGYPSNQSIRIEMGGQNIEFLSLDEDFEVTWKHIMSLARGKVDTPGF